MQEEKIGEYALIISLFKGGKVDFESSTVGMPAEVIIMNLRKIAEDLEENFILENEKRFYPG